MRQAKRPAGMDQGCALRPAVAEAVPVRRRLLPHPGAARRRPQWTRLRQRCS